MKYPVLAIIAAIMIAGSGHAFAQSTSISSTDVIIQRLDALDKRNAKLESENTALRDRVRLLETGRRNAATASPPTTKPPSGQPQPWTSSAAAISSTATNSYASAYKAIPQTDRGGGYYFWIDGLYDRLQLPNYAAGGVHNSDVNIITDQGSAQSFDPRQNAGGIRGAIGYAVPGSDFRIEVGGSYTAGRGSLQNTDLSVPTFNIVLLDGNQTVGAFCPCTVNGTLRTNYDAWKAFGEAKYDAWKSGPLTVTATAALFGGTSDAIQDFTQTYIGTGVTGTYSSHTSVRWTDAGGRLGLDANYAINPLLSVGLKGWAGVAGRDTSMSGNDLDVNTLSGSTSASVISSDTKAVFLANLEGSFTHSLTSSLSVRGFAGVNYDNNVPTLGSPTFVVGAVTVSPIQAGITYASELNYYAGMGLNMKFGDIKYVR